MNRFHKFTSARPAQLALWTSAAVISAAALAWAPSPGFAADAKKAESEGWFSKTVKDLTSDEGAKDSGKDSGKTAKSDKAEKAADPKADAAATAAPAPEIQTMEQLSKAGVKNCLQIAKAVGQATMFGTEYAAASTWHSKQPDNRFSVSMIGQRLAPNAGATNGVSSVFSTPTADGKCDAAALQIIPTQDSCAKIQAQVLEKGKLLGDLAGVPILQNAANAQIMLIPAAASSCVVVALSTAYTE